MPQILDKRRRSLLNYLELRNGKPEAYRYVLRQSRPGLDLSESDWGTNRFADTKTATCFCLHSDVRNKFNTTESDCNS